jgi:hypothetical protein
MRFHELRKLTEGEKGNELSILFMRFPKGTDTNEIVRLSDLSILFMRFLQEDLKR